MPKQAAKRPTTRRARRAPAQVPTWHAAKTQETEQRLRDAIQRLLNGKPTRGSAKLTPSNLADEAGVGRATAYRFKHVLADFEAAIRDLRASDDPENLHERVRRAEAALRERTQEAAGRERELSARVDRYAQQIQYLTARVADLERAAASAPAGSAPAGAAAGVLPLASRRRRS